MGIGTSLGAYYEDFFQHQAGIATPPPTGDKNVVTPQGVEDNKTAEKEQMRNFGLEVSDKPLVTGGKYLGDHPAEGTPEYEQWNNTWSEIRNIGKSTPEEFMNGRSIDEEGSLLDWHKRPDRPDTPYKDDKYMIIRKRSKPNEGQEVPMSSNNPLIHEAGFKDVLGMGEGPRYKLWPERMLESAQDAAGDFMSGKKAGWAMDPETGEYHTSPEMIEAGQDMANVAVLGTAPLKRPSKTIDKIDRVVREVRRQYEDNPPPPVALGEETPAGRQVSEAIASIRQRTAAERPEYHPMSGVEASHEFHRIYNTQGPQEAINFAHRYEETASPHAFNEYEYHVSDEANHVGSRAFQDVDHYDRTANQHPDEMSDQDFHRYGEYQAVDSMSPEHEARWSRIDREWAAQHAQRDLARRSFEERYGVAVHPDRVGNYNSIEEAAAARPWADRPTKFSDKMKERIAEAKTGEKLNFFGTPQETAYGKHYFANENGVGEVNVHYNPGRKELRVSSTGIIQDKLGNKIDPLSYESYAQGPETFGTTATKQILKYLKEKYPEAEWISGFRVSGARAKTGSGADEAKMWIGKGPKPKQPQRRTIDQMLSQYGLDPDGMPSPD